MKRGKEQKAGSKEQGDLRMGRMKQPEIEMVQVAEIVPYARNAKKHPPRQVEKIAMSIREYGFNVPVIVAKNNEIIAGHGRVLAAEELKMASVPCVRVEHLTPKQVQAFRIADNKVAESEWDLEILGGELQALADLDIDIELTGFEVGDLAGLLTPTRGGGEIGGGEVKRRLEIGDVLPFAPTKADMEQFGQRSISVEFSGGKDSTAAALWCKIFIPETPVNLVYVDLGADWYGYHLWVRDLAENLGMPLTILRPERNLFDVFLERGKWPFWTGSYCQHVLHQALDAHHQTLAPEAVVICRGGRLTEKARTSKKQKSRWRTLPALKGYDVFQPLYFADKGVCEVLLVSHGVPIWPGYAGGLRRTACRICPGQRPDVYATIRRLHPGVWEELLALEKKLGPGLWNRGWTADGHIPSFVEAADEGELRLLVGADPHEADPDESDGCDFDAMGGKKPGSDPVAGAA